MVGCAIGICHNNSNKNKGLAFFGFPKEHEKIRRKAWIHACGRSDFKPSKYSAVCAIHFVGGLKSDVPES